MLYNRPGTLYHKSAQKVLGAAEPIMAELDRLITRPAANANTADDQDAMDDDDDGQSLYVCLSIFVKFNAISSLKISMALRSLRLARRRRRARRR